MADKTELRESLVTALELIKGLTVMVCDLGSLVSPLQRALHPQYAHLPLREAYLKCQEELLDELVQTKRESIAVCDAAILRAKRS